MNLRQLKKMISEEYRYWLAEQPIDEPGAPGMPGAPEMPGVPGVEVGPNDIDVMGGGEDSEATLRQIYDMLKAYFEGGAAGAPAGAAEASATGETIGAAGAAIPLYTIPLRISFSTEGFKDGITVLSFRSVIRDRSKFMGIRGRPIEI